MNISDVRIKLVGGTVRRLLAFCSMTLDEALVVRDIRIVDGPHGPFVAMPSRRLAYHCTHCSSKNHLLAAYCNDCGTKLVPPVDAEGGRLRLYADVVHPISTECRHMIHRRVMAAFEEEVRLSKLPGYVCRYADLDEELSSPGRGNKPINGPES